MKTYLDVIEKIIRDAAEEGVQIKLTSPGKLRLTGPAESVGKIKPTVLEHKAAILEHLSRDPWSWLATPTDPADKEAIEWWSSIEHLKEILAYEGWSLGRIGKTLVVMVEAPFSEERLQRLHVAIDGLRACWPVLVHRVEFFPAVTPGEAEKMLERIERYHMADGFKVLGWHGLRYPASWPITVVGNLSPIYTQSLQTEGGLQ